MLGKLLKYELKATARLFLPLYVTILVFALISKLFFPIYNIGSSSSTLINLISSLSIFVHMILMIGLVLMTLFVMIQRFYKSLLGDEGYLMFTLPVKAWQHIFSKLITSMLWIILSTFVALISNLLISSLNIFDAEFSNGLVMVMNEFWKYFGSLGYLVIFEGIVFILLSLASTILTIYGAIALGHLFNKYKLLASFGMFIALKTISQILIVPFMMIFANGMLFETTVNATPTAIQINSLLLASLLYFGVITAGFYVMTNYVLKRKLNLE